jgi:hypothetical protein
MMGTLTCVKDRRNFPENECVFCINNNALKDDSEMEGALGI